MFNSIRWRLQLWHGLLLVLVLAGFGVTAYQLQRATLLRRIDDELQQRLTVATGLIRRPFDEPRRPPIERFAPPNRRPAISQPDHIEARPEPDIKRAGGQDEISFGPNPVPPPPGSFGNPERPSGDETSRHLSAERPRLSEGQPPLGDGMRPRREGHLNPQALKLFEGSGTNAFYYVVWARDGQILARSDTAPDTVAWPGPPDLPPRRNSRAPEPNQIRLRAHQREMFHFSPPGECVLTGRDIGQEISEMRRFAGLLLGAGSGVLIFGLAGGWWLSSRAIRPIQSISGTAAKIARGDLSQRIPVADTENELDQLARVLNSTFARLEAAFAQQTRFTSDAAHELRTPVSVILAQTQSTLNRERSGAEYRETLEACQRAAQRMRRLTESLLELARLDAGDNLIKKETVDLGQVTSECIEFVRPLAANRHISIQPDLSPVGCTGDVDCLKQVIINLLSNAIQYNKQAGNIQVRVEQNGQFAIVTVADTGIGISPENLPHIFERFWRADQARSHAESHTGLGLAIVKSIVDAHGGTIEISSEPEKGSRFIVRLPI